jgi:hypothetical protein
MQTKPIYQLISSDITLDIHGEYETGYLLVEGSSSLWDELFAFQGLDKNDIENFYLVAEYIKSLKKYQPNNQILNMA